jgi:hypothetical protein
MEKNIIFRAVIEILGKPKEHIDKSLRGFIKQLKENEEYEVISEDYAELKKQEEQELWMGFAELEVKTAKIEQLTAFCFNYMPSLIEIIEPKELRISERDFSTFLNDLQSKLHTVDMVAKQVKMENDHLKKNMSALMRNYLLVLLAKESMTAEQISNLTGVKQDNLEDYLDHLIDEGKVDLKDGRYNLKK